MFGIISHRAEDWDRKRFLVVHLDDGRILNEHQFISWANIDPAKILVLQVRICGKHWSIDRKDLPESFREFIYFKTALTGIGSHVRKLATGEDETLSRTIGWTDGIREYLIEIDEKTGRKIREYIRGNISRHPKSKLQDQIIIVK